MINSWRMASIQARHARAGAAHAAHAAHVGAVFFFLFFAGTTYTACGGSLPNDKGVNWSCRANSVTVAGTEVLQNGVFYEVRVCANANVPASDVADYATDQCKDDWKGTGCCWANFPPWETPVSCSIPPQNCQPSGVPCKPGSFVFEASTLAQNVVTISAGSSPTTVTVDDHKSPALSPSGTLSYSIDRSCTAFPCAIEITNVQLTVAPFDIDDHPVKNVQIRNAGFMTGSIDANGNFTLSPNGSRLSVGFTVDDDNGSTTIVNNFPLLGSAIPATDAFSIDGTLTQDDVAVDLHLVGHHTNRPPIAAFAPKGNVECNMPRAAAVTLDATASSDPDGNIRAYRWSIVDGPTLGTGSTLANTFPMGPTNVRLLVQDAQLGADVTHAVVNVVDTTAPVLVAPPNVFQESCDTGGAIVDPGMPTFSDVCDPNPTFAATIVEINGVPASIPLVSGYTFKQGTTVIRYEVSDVAGHVTAAFQTVTLDFGASCCPPNLQPLLGTPSDDTLDGGNKGQCIVGFAGNDSLSAHNARDVILGGPGNDTCNGGNGSELIRGGGGDDTITGGNGADHALWGGPGRDRIAGGNGNDILRGGAGADTLLGGNGNDVFVIASACEAVAGEYIDGGNGVDRVESPLDASQLAARGVTIVNVEQFVVTPTLPDAECVDP